MSANTDIDYIKVSRLREYFDYDYCWNGIYVSLKDVEDYMKQEKKTYNLDCCDKYMEEWNKNDHIERIAFFIDHPQEITPIYLDNKCIGMNILPIPILEDGHHRFMAAMYRNDDTIPAHYSGLVKLLEYLKGESDIKPEY